MIGLWPGITNPSPEADMNLKQFIRDNRQELDEAIKRVIGSLPYKNDEERRLWVLNDEGLHNWARSEGVRI